MQVYQLTIQENGYSRRFVGNRRTRPDTEERRPFVPEDARMSLDSRNEAMARRGRKTSVTRSGLPEGFVGARAATTALDAAPHHSSDGIARNLPPLNTILANSGGEILESSVTADDFDVWWEAGTNLADVVM